MNGSDDENDRLQCVQRPDTYLAGRTLRSTFRPEEQIGSDLITLMLELARVPDAGGGGEPPTRR